MKQKNVVFELQKCKVCGKVICFSVGWAYKIEAYNKTTYFCSFSHLQEYRRQDQKAHEDALRMLEEKRAKAAEHARQVQENSRDASESSSETQQGACTTVDEDFITEGN